MNIIFDLDGTLINSKFRLYKLFRELTPDCQITFDDYWILKQKKITNEMILEKKFGYRKKDISNFVNTWMKLIENPKYLCLDTAFTGIKKKLSKLSYQAKLFICTNRQYRKPTIEQLRHLEILQYFNKILVTEQKFSKDFLIKKFIPGYDQNDWLVGDTGADIEVGKILNVRTCAVTSGFHSMNTLLNYNPDLILDTVLDFVP